MARAAAPRPGPPPGGARAGAGAVRRGPDPATPLGLIGGIALIVAAVGAGGDARAFLDLPSALIVLGGTLAVTTVSFPLRDVFGTPAVLLATLVRRPEAPHEAASRLLELAGRARREGPLALGDRLGRYADRPLLQRGLGLVADGAAPGEIEPLLHRELDTVLERHRQAVAVLRRAAEAAPAMGLIGTLVGLVQMLGRLEDPAMIGPAMAVALLTTFYGAVLAHMVFIPLAVKLERTSAHEALLGQLQTLAVLSIGRRENPRRLEDALNSLLPPARRLRRLA